MAKYTGQMARFHKWDTETAWLDEQLRSAGCFALVDVNSEGLMVWPRERFPKVLNLQLTALNNKALARQFCIDLMNEAGFVRVDDNERGE